MDMISVGLLVLALLCWMWAQVVAHRNRSVSAVMAYLANHPDMWFTFTKLHEMTHVNPSTLDLVLDQLEEWRLIEQRTFGPDYQWKYRTEHM
jgi:hypothetical protein